MSDLGNRTAKMEVILFNFQQLRNEKREGGVKGSESATPRCRVPGPRRLS